MVWWSEGSRGGSENIRHLVCLCVSKGNLALTGVFFPPWNEAEVKMEEIKLSELGSGDACWEAKKKKKMAMSPQIFRTLVYRNYSASGPKD